MYIKRPLLLRCSSEKLGRFSISFCSFLLAIWFLIGFDLARTRGFLLLCRLLDSFCAEVTGVDDGRIAILSLLMVIFATNLLNGNFCNQGISSVSWRQSSNAESYILCSSSVGFGLHVFFFALLGGLSLAAIVAFPQFCTLFFSLFTHVTIFL
ncbi:hypothetical protein KFK09_018411 [Dendrobium nobile]|uniref:Uncharacterized protein n=1 Tax=Dendrobium nobile TaxID=94219 RepID=A0A8T3AWW8_DENNO|nr:hypothetical protein KFK09_018411 [Dendrobium nobile]